MFFNLLLITLLALVSPAWARITGIHVDGPVAATASHIPLTIQTENYIQNNKQYSFVTGLTPSDVKVYPGTAGTYLLPKAIDLQKLPGTQANTTYMVPFHTQSYKNEFQPGQWQLKIVTLESVGASNSVFTSNYTTNITLT